MSRSVPSTGGALTRSTTQIPVLAAIFPYRRVRLDQLASQLFP